MNDRQMENKVRHDAKRVKKDLNTLIGDSAVRVGQFEESVNQASDKAKEDLTKWMENSVSQMSEGFEKIANEARETVTGAVATAKKDLDQGLIQYNTRAQEVASKVPGGFSEKAAKYPWVTVSIALAVGFFLGSLLRLFQRKTAWVSEI